MNNRQYKSNEYLEQMVMNLNEDLTLMEQLKIARNLIQLVHGDLFMQQETEEELLTINNLGVIADSLDEIIKKYEVGE